MSLNRFPAIALGFVFGVGSCFAAYAAYKMHPPFHPVDWAEEQRVTSPDRKFDAILIREGLGPTDEPNWYMYVAERGQRGHFDATYSLLHATGLKGQSLNWSANRVVVIRYDHAEIDRFKNFWDAVDPPTTDPSGKPEDFVEIRLAASAP